MKAFVHRLENGKIILGSGMVAGPYLNLKHIMKFGMKHLPPGTYSVEAFINWERCYGKPDIDVLVIKTKDGVCHAI